MQDISRVITLMKSNPNTSNQCNGNYNLIQVTRRCYLNLNLKFYIMKTFIWKTLGKFLIKLGYEAYGTSEGRVATIVKKR
jgi:hypothetical protein